MRTLLIGLDCAAPEILFTEPRLTNLRQLMSRGCYGRLESVIPPITVPAWMCMATSQDPGSLGVYGFRNRTSYAYDGLGVVNSQSITAPAIWDYFGEDGQVAVLSVPPGYPPRKVNGVSIGCFLTPDTTRVDFTYPASLKKTITDLVGPYPVDVGGFRTDDKRWLRDQIYEMTRKHFQVIRHLMDTMDWTYFQFVEIGLDRVQHGFWKYHDRAHRQYVPDSGLEDVVRDYYVYLDEELGTILSRVDDNDTVLVASDHGAQRLDGGFCVNEWLQREGLLALKERPAKPGPLTPAQIDWSRTKVWSEGGYYARVFLNVEGREPAGIVPQDQYEAVLDDVRARLEALPDDRGAPMGTTVFRPKDIYRQQNRIPPDLIAHFGGLFWRSIGGVGYNTLYVQENDTGPDDCNHAQFGGFILNGPRLDIRGEVEGMHLLDVAPTLLDMAGRPIPPAMQGRSLLRRTVSQGSSDVARHQLGIERKVANDV
jgi:predicted AlkP superfamily phosphohydrolase/phosphomutase